MTADDIPWELCRSLVAIVRYGSLSGAARAVGLTQPTLGRHLDQLEARLGAPLFFRSAQGLTPTDAALTLARIGETMANAAEALARAAFDKTDEIAGAVRITASEVIGAEVLPTILGEFASRHAGIAFDLRLTNQIEDLQRREADVAVSMVRPTQSGLLGAKLGETWLGLYAHRRYIGDREPPRTLDEAAEHFRLIGFDRYPVPLKAASEAGVRVTREMFSLRVDNDLAQIAAIRAGYGIGVCQIGLARRDPDLVRVAEDAFAVPLEMWLTMHEDLRASARVRAVYEHLAEGLSAYLATSQ